MAFDFPASPTNGQVFTPPGGPTYTYDLPGTKWLVTGTGLSGLSVASTTDVLTGTSSSVAVTPDALAALWEKGVNVASAATVTFPEGGYFHVTGTVTITDIDWAVAVNGRWAWVIFDTALTLTHSATLLLPGNANIQTAANDRALFVQDASDNVICLAYQRAASAPAYAGGIYTPGTSGILNVAAITAYACQYSRVGSFVVVSGRIDIDPITASTATALAITLPVASDFTLTEQLGGTFVSIGVQGQSGGIIADVASNNARFDYTPASAVNQANPFILAYQVL